MCDESKFSELQAEIEEKDVQMRSRMEDAEMRIDSIAEAKPDTKLIAEAIRYAGDAIGASIEKAAERPALELGSIAHELGEGLGNLEATVAKAVSG